MSFSGRTLTLYGCNPRFNPQYWAGLGGSDNSVEPTGGRPSENHFCYGKLLCLGFVSWDIFKDLFFNLFIFEVLKFIYTEFGTIFFVIVCDNFQFSVSVPLFLTALF